MQEIYTYNAFRVDILPPNGDQAFFWKKKKYIYVKYLGFLYCK